MSSELKRLPIGLSDFEKIRDKSGDYLYVDKTKALAEMLTAGDYLFFSRPRRFGKSLLCSIIKYIYQGRRDLFEGLAIEPLWDWTKTNPVIHVSLTETASTSPEHLEKSLLRMLMNCAEENELVLRADYYSQALPELLRLLHAKSGRRAVVVIDEYEKPVHDHMDDLPLARKLRDVLAAFYGSMKGCDAFIEKLFVTGVGRMVKTSIFSGFNQMIDLTLDEIATTVCGYTQSELTTYFTPYLAPLAKANSITEDRAWSALRERYNGYWWGKGERVYNPWAILNCVRSKEFSNFWWSSGTPSALIKMTPALKEPENMDHIEATDLSLLFDLENVKAEPLLWQAGYLTIKERDENAFILGFPNGEVREAWSAMMLNRFKQSNEGADGFTTAVFLFQALKKGDRQTFEKSIISLFASIPFHLHEKKESFYHAVFMAALQAVGGQIVSEHPTDKGRVDAVVKTSNYIYIIEFKLGLASEALAQIKAKRYYEMFLADSRKIILLGAGGFEEKNIQCLWDEAVR